MFVYHIKIFQVIVHVFENNVLELPKTSKRNWRGEHQPFWINLNKSKHFWSTFRNYHFWMRSNNWYQNCPPAISDQGKLNIWSKCFGTSKNKHSTALWVLTTGKEMGYIWGSTWFSFWLEAATPQTATKGGGTMAKHSHLAEFRRQRSEFKQAKRAETWGTEYQRNISRIYVESFVKYLLYTEKVKL